SRFLGLRWEDADLLASPLCVGAELHVPVNEREDRVVAAKPHVGPSVEPRAPLADDDRPRSYGLAVKSLHSKTLAVAIAPILGAAHALLVCHGLSLANRLDNQPRELLLVAEDPSVSHLVLVFHETELRPAAVLSYASAQ